MRVSMNSNGVLHEKDILAELSLTLIYMVLNPDGTQSGGPHFSPNLPVSTNLTTVD
ncbi:MAG: hypothetical protein PHH84_06855 [Oscillospiraceae bacterium]|nr:hypothetical protein [Oscillospiraceae bacterium]MDD4414475.1 hypothetical protein [Oscillospiraceae bacterium]